MTPPARHYGMDWLRIGAFALLILYHVGLVFGPWPYEIKANPTADWVAIPLLLTNPWRLSLLFAISGYASAAILERDGRVGAFVRSRLARLGIPLLFGMAVIVTPQPWVALVTQHGYPHGFGRFIAHDYYAFQFIDGVAMPTWMHLWFVVYLLVYTLLLGLFLLLPERVRGTVRHGGERLLAGPLLLPLPVLLIFLARSRPGGWTETHGLFDDGVAHLIYLPMFLFGVLLRGSDALRRAIAKQWPLAAVLGVAGYAVIVGVEVGYPGNTPLPAAGKLPYNLARSAQAWGMMIALFGIAERFWNRDHRWRATLVEAVFPFYIIHQTIILVVGYWLRGTGAPPPAQFVMLVAATAIGCWLFYLVGRTVGPLRPLIGLKRHARPPETLSPSPPSRAAVPSP